MLTSYLYLIAYGHIKHRVSDISKSQHKFVPSFVFRSCLISAIIRLIPKLEA